MSCDTSEGAVSIRSAVKDLTGVHIPHEVWSQHRQQATLTADSPKGEASPEDAAAAAEAMLRDLGIDPSENRAAREFLNELADGEVTLTNGQARVMRTLAFAIQDEQRKLGYMPDLTIPSLPEKGEPTQVLIVRGMPGCGKSSWAKRIIEEYPPGSVARMNNDDITQMMFGKPDVFVPNMERTFARMRGHMLGALLSQPNIRMVIVDNTNLSVKTVNNLAKTTAQFGGDVVVDDRFLSVPLEECLRRNANRDRQVPVDVMHRMHKAARNLKPYEDRLGPPIEPFPNDDMSLPVVVICDIDGTVADLNGRSPFAWDEVHNDLPRPEIIAMVRGYVAQNIEVQFLTGRDGSCREATEAWIAKHIGPGFTVHMKDAGDHRSDFVTKPETIHREFAGKRRILTAIDDRESVIAMMRNHLRIPVIDVGTGEDFA